MSWRGWFASLSARLRRHPSEADLLACLDGELEPRRESRVQAHVGVCRPCSERMNRLAATMDSIRGLFPAHELDGEIQPGRQRLEQALGEREAQAHASSLEQRFLGRLAADPVRAAEAGVILRTLLGWRAACWTLAHPCSGAGREQP